MIDKVVSDINKTAEAARVAPNWVLAVVLVLSPAVASFGSSAVTNATSAERLTHLEEDMAEERASRKQFEADCAEQRKALDGAIMQLRLDMQEQQLIAKDTQATLKEMGARWSAYQDKMTDLVGGISKRMPQ